MKKIKSFIKNFIIVALLTFAFLCGASSLFYLVFEQFKAVAILVISVVVLVLFGVVNKGVFQ